MFSTETEITAQFYDLDPMGVMWHGNYARFLEQARCDLLGNIGYNYDEMAANGYMWPIVDMQQKFVRPVRFAQVVVVTSTLVEYENRLKISYLIRDKNTGETIMKAQTVQVAVKSDTGELLLESPPELTEKVKKII